MGGYLVDLVKGSALLDLDTDISITPPGFEDRYFEYAVPFVIPVGAVAVGLPFITEDDADFIAYSRKIDTDVDFSVRYTDSEGRYMQNSLVRAFSHCAGKANCPTPLVRPFFVPAGGVLLFDITANQAPAFGTGNAQIVFVGVKRFRA